MRSRVAVCLQRVAVIQEAVHSGCGGGEAGCRGGERRRGRLPLPRYAHLVRKELQLARRVTERAAASREPARLLLLSLVLAEDGGGGDH